MKRRLFVLLGIISIFIICSCQKEVGNQASDTNIPLSIEKKLEDYDFLYKVIKDNSPTVMITDIEKPNKWQDAYLEYKRKVEESQNDEDFFSILNTFLNELNSPHTQMATKEFVQYMKGVYEEQINKSNEGLWQTYLLSDFNQPQVVKRNNLENINKESSSSYADRQFQHQKQIITTDIVKDKIGYIYIPRMKTPNEWGNDEEIIKKYLDGIKKYDSLVIDIRGNMGGDSRYWSEFLVPYIAGTDYKYHSYHLYKDGEKIREYISYRKSIDKDFMDNISQLDSEKRSLFKNISKDALDQLTYVYNVEQLISPWKYSIGFQGKIYVIIDSYVYSSADSFADFCKTTKFATLVGQRTLGGGISSDPLICYLPNSGYVFRFEKELGISSDGRISAVEKTTPDVVVEDTKFQSFDKDLCIQRILSLESERN